MRACLPGDPSLGHARCIGWSVKAAEGALRPGCARNAIFKPAGTANVGVCTRQSFNPANIGAKINGRLVSDLGASGCPLLRGRVIPGGAEIDQARVAQVGARYRPGITSGQCANVGAVSGHAARISIRMDCRPPWNDRREAKSNGRHGKRHAGLRHAEAAPGQCQCWRHHPDGTMGPAEDNSWRRPF